jgi:hypothetical protein
VRVLGGFRATSVRAGRSVCATARVVHLLATLVPEPSQRGMKEGRKEVGRGREGGTGRDGTGGADSSFPFLSFLSILAGYFKKGSGRGELGGKRCIWRFSRGYHNPDGRGWMNSNY